MKKVLIIVDAQNDFIRGSLPVPNAEQVVWKIKEIIPNYDRVIFTMDWHPLNHCSFDINKGPWPVHCLQGDEGACIDPLLINTCKLYNINYEVYLKGMDSELEEYGAFKELIGDTFPNHIVWINDQTELDDLDEYDICGFAGDFCVKHTMENLKQYKLDVTLIPECTGYINNA